MAIAERSETISRVDPRVLHPLDRLRGTIRKYVVIEGLLSAAIFVAAWFALGMLFDFGLFKLATWDWVLDAPAWLRAVALIAAVVLLAGIVILRIAVRLNRELSYPSLALVLERKFPKVLGDRLITAVELADVEHQAKFGYSGEMIRQTIDEARERVAIVPVNDVFNWRRLRRMAAIALLLVLGVLVAGYAAFAIGAKSVSPYRFGWRFAHVTGALLERNVLIRNVPWPRRAHLELVGFPGADLRVGKDAPDPVIKAKAYRWVIADRAAPMGWRPMLWNDVNESLLGGPVPALPSAVLQSTGELGNEPSQWELDQIQAVVIEDKESREKINSALPGSEFLALQNDLERVFEKLGNLAASPSMGRTLRKLDVPEKVALAYSGASKTGEVTLGPQKNNEFSSPMSDLKESVHFVVRAEDFRTTSKTITLVPPPLFTSLTEIEYQPAYLHHTPPDFDYSLLRGKRQLMQEKPISLTGDRSRVKVWSGSELILTAKLDTDLTSAFVVPKVGVLPGAKPGSSDPVPLTIADDKRSVSLAFQGEHRLSVGHTYKHSYVEKDGKPASTMVTTQAVFEFDIVVAQADGVKATRQIALEIAEDQPPVVELAPDVIRKVGNVYYVTPRAKIPFNPESYVRDDHGLSKVAYDFIYWSEDSDIGRALRVQLLTRPFLYAIGPASTPNAVASTYMAAKFKDLDKGDQRRTGSAELSRYIDQRSNLVLQTPDTLARSLREPRPEPTGGMITKVELKSPEQDFFDIAKLKLQSSASEIQTRYRLDLNIVATDTNYDTGPKSGQNADPIRLLIVSEGDLLAEINKEEESFATRLDEALIKLVGARKRYEFMRLYFGQGEQIDNARVKSQDVLQDVGKARDIVSGLVREYRRIHRECIVNDVTEVTRDRFGKFANRIDRVCGETPPPVTKDESPDPPKMTFPEAERRLEVVNGHLVGNNWGDIGAISLAEVALLDLENVVRTLRNEFGELQNKEKLRRQLEELIKRQEQVSKQLSEWQVFIETRLKKKTPDIGETGPVFLTKGETRKIKHRIDWLQYPKDDLVVKFAVTDKDKKPAPPEVLGVAPEMKLSFEMHQLSFEYDVKAGAKEGEYTLTLVPEAGDPVSVAVTIK